MGQCYRYATCKYTFLEVNKSLTIRTGIEIFSNFNLLGTFCSSLTQHFNERTNIVLMLETIQNERWTKSDSSSRLPGLSFQGPILKTLILSLFPFQTSAYPARLRSWCWDMSGGSCVVSRKLHFSVGRLRRRHVKSCLFLILHREFLCIFFQMLSSPLYLFICLD